MGTVEKIISGGQTGADQAALDTAIEMGLKHGGWVPRGRRTEEGPLPDRYEMKETKADGYAERTARNVEEADATVIFSHGRLTGGSQLTQQLAAEKSRPYLHLDLEQTPRFDAARRVSEWLGERQVTVLNVAGPRASEDPIIYKAVRDVLSTVLFLAEMNTRPEPVWQIPRPVTIQEAVRHLTDVLPLKNRTAMANMGVEEVRGLTRLKTLIDRQLGLPSGNPELVKACLHRARKEGGTSADAAEVIVTALWRHLQQTHRLRRVK